MGMNDYISAEFSPLADWDHRNRAHKDGHSAEWKTLSVAVKSGAIPGFRLSNGRWYVHAAEANEFLARSKAAPAKTPARTDDSRIEAAVIALCEINNGITLMQATLERLTAAVESIATQPKTAQPDGLATMSSNGFHN